MTDDRVLFGLDLVSFATQRPSLVEQLLEAPTIGARVRVLRTHLHLSRREFAKRAGIGFSGLDLIEKDDIIHRLDAIDLLGIHVAFGVDPNTMMGVRR